MEDLQIMQLEEVDRALIISNLECQQESYQGQCIECYHFQNNLQNFFIFYRKKWKIVVKF